MTRLCLFLAAFLVALFGARSAFANDASDAGEVHDASSADADESNDGVPPLACDGALCDTTNGSACDVGARPIGAGARSDTAIAVFVVALFIVLRRRKASTFAIAIALSYVTLSTEARADPGTSPIDVKVHDPPPPERTIVVSVEPLPAVTLGKWTASVLFAPVKHHAIILSPFYATTDTVPIYVFNDASIQTGQASAQLPKQTFRGFGTELGYRYYFGENGPRGFFLSPSLLLGSFTATASDSTQTSYWNLGLAADAGYEALVGDRFAITLGAGLEGTITTKSIPSQQFPAELYANGGIRPRLLLSFGWAF